ncbi:right-handed parallel beta-helix repeat-containing protein [Kitasatospora sp. McL0602]|uniref:right-handed parallel beta-helix repeat-containing protein n=1 Tax=Kitasatospora sp. McL0602 TaxID=3439530 RepID=UPI003F8A8338
MPSIHRRRQLATAVVVASTGLVGAGWALPAAAETGSTLYVSKSAACSDTGPGSQAQPFCTIQAGADAAKPGQTVLVEPTTGGYPESVRITHSGEPGKPIVIRGISEDKTGKRPEVRTYGPDSTIPFRLTGVHDVTVQNFYVMGRTDGIQVSDSARVVLDRNEAYWSGWGLSGANIHLTGSTRDTTVSRNQIEASGLGGIAVDKGVTGTVITTNLVTRNEYAGIWVTDAPGTVITGNSVVSNYGTGIRLDGNSGGATIENNVVAGSDGPSSSAPGTQPPDPSLDVELRVSAGSVAGTKTDYNVLHPVSTGSAYSWGGTTYQQPAAFTAATTQGAHDLREDPPFPEMPWSAAADPTGPSGLTDSADASAPGELDTDLHGNPRVDDPKAPNSGGGYHDRGAVELQAYGSLDLKLAVVGGRATATATAGQYWSDTTTYTFDFGDGSKPVVTTSPTADHAYRAAGSYTVTVTANGTGANSTAHTTSTATVAAAAAMGFVPTTPYRVLDTRPGAGHPGSLRLGPGATTRVHVSGQSDAVVLNVTAVNPSAAGYLSVYPAGGPRPATSNVNFVPGQTVPNLVTTSLGGSDEVEIFNHSGDTDVVVDVVGSYQAGAGDRFTALAPSRLLDTRRAGGAVGPESVTQLQVRGVGGVPADATSVVLNLTSTDGDAGGYLAVYPSGTRWAGTSNLNFAARQTVANQVVVPIGADGKVSIYNKFGHTQVVADVFGYYGPTGTSLFTPVAPTRLVDTRTAGHSALGQGGTLRVASGAPAGATGAVLNVTSTAATAGGYLTVWADGAAKPGTSNVNFLAGKTVPNHVTTPLGANGSFDVYNFLGQTQVVADLFGYFSK